MVTSINSLDSKDNLRSIQVPNLIPGTRKIVPDPLDGIDSKYAAQALASQESSLGVFRYLDSRERVIAESTYDSQTVTDEEKFSRLKTLHSFREKNMINASKSTLN